MFFNRNDKVISFSIPCVVYLFILLDVSKYTVVLHGWNNEKMLIVFDTSVLNRVIDRWFDNVLKHKSTV